jgi:hypothetical protein
MPGIFHFAPMGEDDPPGAGEKLTHVGIGANLTSSGEDPGPSVLLGT